jgi:hypothetical protein
VVSWSLPQFPTDYRLLITDYRRHSPWSVVRSLVLLPFVVIRAIRVTSAFQVSAFLLQLPPPPAHNPAMRIRVKIALALFFVSLVGLVLWQVVQQREPVYQGRTLTSWVKDFRQDASRRGAFIPNPAATAAIRQIGTNGIPTLLHLLRTKDSAFKANMMRLLARQRLIKVKVDYLSPIDWSQCVWFSFCALGTNKTQSAVPGLIEAANDSTIPLESRITAVSVLGPIGPSAKSAVPTLLQLTTNKDDYMSRAAVRALLIIDPEAAANAGITITNALVQTTRRQ